MTARVPVIALTGHLGAGKTSLLNHLLRAPGARLGVIVNDFGELNVDAALVSGQVIDAVAHFQTVDTRETPPNRFAAATLVVIGKADLRARPRAQSRHADRAGRSRRHRPGPGLRHRSRRRPRRSAAPGSAAAGAVRRAPRPRARSGGIGAARGPGAPPGALADLLEEPPQGAHRL
ncbi:GTP-binding protein [Kocuria palustris]|uniref:GTP-binding protein n=1 Tax=Kocuria palustris TaxID=71999 RepID=UPI00242BBC97|nr:GTP-binding protein [Kocuria palustris]